MLAVAAEAQLLVEVRVERGDARRRGRAVVALEPPGGRFAHPLEALQVRRRIQRRILDAGDRQRRRRERFARLVERAQQVVGDARKARQEGQRHGSIVARTHPQGYRPGGDGCRVAGVGYPASAIVLSSSSQLPTSELLQNRR